MKYDLSDLLTFLYVAKLKSFSKAAEVLDISRTVATTRINNLENAVEMTLLARTTREVNLTNEGREFFKYCESIFEKVDGLEYFLNQKTKPKGTLRIAIPPYFSKYNVVPHLNDFLQEYSDITLDIILTENPLDVINEAIDLQIRIQIPDEENLTVSKLKTNSKIICASPKYIAKHGIPGNPHDLEKHNCLIFGENDVWKLKHKKNHKIIELENLSGNVKCDNGEIIKELALSGLGITLKSACDIADELKSKKLIPILEDYEVMNETSFYAVYAAKKYPSPKIEAFVRFFQKKLNS